MEAQHNGHGTTDNSSSVILENGEEIVKVHKMATSNGIAPHDPSKYTNGPDQILPAEQYTNCEPGGHVRLRMGTRGVTAEPPVSVPGLLRRTAARYPDGIAFASKKADGKWHKVTYKQYQESVRAAAKGFLKLGLQRYHSVCILGFNSPQWYISDLAAIHAGGYAAGIYTTNSAEACYHCLLSSRANICVVQDKKQLDKILAVRSRLPHLKAIVQWEPPVDTSVPGVYTWEQVLEIGSKESDAQLDWILKTMGVNECCTLVYTDHNQNVALETGLNSLHRCTTEITKESVTLEKLYHTEIKESGTVGQPKAVMLSHDNLTWDAYSISLRVADLQPQRESLVSFLPLSHVAAQVVDLYLTLSSGVTVYFAQPDALKGSLVETLKEIRPTRFLAVPRVWEKMHEKMMAVAASNGSLKRSLASWAKGTALQFHVGRINGYDGMTCGYKMARSIVFSKVKEALGLDRCVTFVTAAAPLSSDIKKYFLSLDIPIMDAFGMSEASGAHSLSIEPKFTLDSVGEIIDGVETRFAGSASPNGPGEICLRGRHVFMGYLSDEEKTRAAIDADGWLLSGDVGRADSKNFLYITGRIKELLITAGGENVAPVLIEQTICAELLQVGHAVLIGDRRKFLSVLLTLKSKTDPETGKPMDELERETAKWIASLGCKATTISEVIAQKDPKVWKAIEEGIVRANKHAISNAQKVQKFALLPADFSTFTGELGPTMKLKRNVIYEKYADIIEDFYKE